MKKLVFVFMLFFLLSNKCSNDNVNIDKVEKEYYYARYDTYSSSGDEKLLVGYTVRNYTYKKDTIIEKITYIKKSGKVIDVQKQKFIQKDGNLYLFMNHKEFPYLILSAKDSCWTYEHPLFFTLRNCYKGDSLIGNEKVHILQSACAECADGQNEILYLDKDFVLYKKIYLNLMSFDLEIRIDKNKFPY